MREDARDHRTLRHEREYSHLAAESRTHRDDNRGTFYLDPGSDVEYRASLDTTHVRIHSSGRDDGSGSGLKGYSVFLRQDAGVFNDVGTLLTSNAMELTVQRGHSYSFFTRATDNTDNLEPQKSMPDQVVTIGTVVLGTGGPQLPRVTLLHQNAPNPWRTSTLIRFELASDSDVTLEVFDIQGRVVARPLDHKRLEAGNHSVALDRLPGGPGVYFYRMHAKAFESTKRMVRLG